MYTVSTVSLVLYVEYTCMCTDHFKVLVITIGYTLINFVYSPVKTILLSAAVVHMDRKDCYNKY